MTLSRNVCNNTKLSLYIFTFKSGVLIQALIHVCLYPESSAKKYSTDKTMSFNFYNDIYYQMETKKISLTGNYIYIPVSNYVYNFKWRFHTYGTFPCLCPISLLVHHVTLTYLILINEMKTNMQCTKVASCWWDCLVKRVINRYK